MQNAFLQAEDLPFRDVLTEEEIHAAFVAENACFGEDEDDIYTPALTLWGWLAQAMHAEKARSCVAAVARITALCVALGRQPPSPDTGTYCRARAKLPEPVLRRLVYTVGDELESRVPADWLWLGRHVKMGDGTTLLTPDTDANQAEFGPSDGRRNPAWGFPSCGWSCCSPWPQPPCAGWPIGPYKGKETGEPALLRELLDRFQRGDVFLGDCAYCSYFMLALLLARGVDVVTRQHQGRRTDFRCGQRLGNADHVVVWERPQRPEWMDEETYATIPETLTVRELKVHVDVPGFRVRELVVVTTLTDAERYPQAGDRAVVPPSLARGTRSAEHQDQPAAGRSSRQEAGDDPPRDLGPLAGLQSDPQGDGPGGAPSREVAAGIELRRCAGGRHRRVGAGQRGRCRHAVPCTPKRNTAASPGSA